MTVRTRYYTREELEAKRDEVLERLHMTLDEFVELYRTKGIQGEEWHAKRELDWILGLLEEVPDWEGK